MKTFYIILFIFSLLGMFTASNIIHELSHWADFKDYVAEDRICFLNYNSETGNIGYYAYYGIDEENREIVETIKKFTERKAVILSLVMPLLFLISFYFVINDYYKEKKK